MDQLSAHAISLYDLLLHCSQVIASGYFCASKLLSAHIQLAQDLGEIGDAQEQIESGSMKSRCAGQFVCA